MMRWRLSFRADPSGRALADRHYNRQSIGAAQFPPPGGCACFVTDDERAVWVTSTPFAEYVKHAWPGAWVNSLFRNEGAGLSSELIREAVAASLFEIGPAPPLGIITFVDANKTRRKRDPGRCYRKAGFRHIGFTQGGLYALQLLPCDMPPPLAPIHATGMLWPRAVESPRADPEDTQRAE